MIEITSVHQKSTTEGTGGEPDVLCRRQREQRSEVKSQRGIPSTDKIKKKERKEEVTPQTDSKKKEEK
jgi:hypothetical protein